MITFDKEEFKKEIVFFGFLFLFCVLMAGLAAGLFFLGRYSMTLLFAVIVFGTFVGTPFVASLRWKR